MNSRLPGETQVLGIGFPSTERPVKIIPYFGSLPNSIGSDGDFYVDEMTNMLYGPKTDGVWPEDGVSAAGLCKRTFITLTGSRTAHVSPARSEGRIRSLAQIDAALPVAKRVFESPEPSHQSVIT